MSVVYQEHLPPYSLVVQTLSQFLIDSTFLLIDPTIQQDSFLPQSKNMHLWSFGDDQIHVHECVRVINSFTGETTLQCVCVCVCVCVINVIKSVKHDAETEPRTVFYCQIDSLSVGVVGVPQCQFGYCVDCGSWNRTSDGTVSLTYD